MPPRSKRPEPKEASTKAIQDEQVGSSAGDNQVANAVVVPPKWHQVILLGIVIHFTALVLGFVSNLGPSELVSRFLRVLAPYAVTFHQEMGSLPLELTHAAPLDQDYQIQVQTEGDANWQTMLLDGSTGRKSYRAKSLLRMSGGAAVEENHDLLTSIFAVAVKRHESANPNARVVRIRLIRSQALPQVLDGPSVRGELLTVPPEYAEKSMLESRVVRLPGGAVGFIRVLEPLRTAKPKPSTTSGDSSGESAPSNSEVSR